MIIAQMWDVISYTCGTPNGLKNPIIVHLWVNYICPLPKYVGADDYRTTFAHL